MATKSNTIMVIDKSIEIFGVPLYLTYNTEYKCLGVYEQDNKVESVILYKTPEQIEWSMSGSAPCSFLFEPMGIGGQVGLCILANNQEKILIISILDDGIQIF